MELYDFGADRFGIEQAERYHRGLMAMFDLLSQNPRMARLRKAFSPPVRIHPYESHVIVYAEEPNGILVVRVLHGRQHWEQALS